MNVRTTEVAETFVCGVPFATQSPQTDLTLIRRFVGGLVLVRVHVSPQKSAPQQNTATSRALSDQSSSVPGPCGMVQLGYHILHIWSLTRIGEPAAFNGSPQPLGKTKVLRPLRFPWSIALHDRMYYPTYVCNVPIRSVSTKNPTVCGLNLCENGKMPNKPRTQPSRERNSPIALLVDNR